MFKLILSLGLIVAALAVPYKGLPKHFKNPRIVGGSLADIKDFPYQVSFQLYGVHMCGGSIIDEYTVLTAAHCLEGLQPVLLNIMVGSEHNKEGEKYEVTSFISHPKYDPKSLDNDMGILKLATPIKFNDHVKPIELQAYGEEVPVGTTSVVSGWGSTTPRTDDNFLRKTELNVVSHEECQAAYKYKDITKRMLCAKQSGHDACQGDSGGPLVANNKLIGVVSWGFGCARPEYPGIYAKVSELRPWIEEHKN